MFKGFVQGVPGSVLSGGQYDRLMRKMNRRANAVGFAVYMDMLERLVPNNQSFDVDIVLLYDSEDDYAALYRTVSRLITEGNRVMAVRVRPNNVRYRTLARFVSGEVETLENNA